MRGIVQPSLSFNSIPKKHAGVRFSGCRSKRFVERSFRQSPMDLFAIHLTQSSKECHCRAAIGNTMAAELHFDFDVSERHLSSHVKL
jgi:hypothetical protein